MRVQFDGQEIDFSQEVVEDLIAERPDLIKRSYLKSLGHVLEGKPQEYINGLWESLKNEEAAIAHAKNRRIKQIESNSA